MSDESEQLAVTVTAGAINGCYILDGESVLDHRGSFTRWFETLALASIGSRLDIVQCCSSANVRAGTLRGLHYQRAPYEETKLVRCIRGSAFDVVADIRPASDTYGRWFGVELSASKARSILVPPGCAHGYITLESDTELLYLIDEQYVPSAAAGVRWDDPHLDVQWPMAPTLMSERDQELPCLSALVSRLD